MATTLVREAVGVISAQLRVGREDISFHNTAPDRVRIEITVHNDACVRSAPTTALIQGAPFGGFLPWRTLGHIPVPAIEGGAATVIEAEAACEGPRPGGPRRIIPGRLLTALAFDDGDEEGRAVESRRFVGEPDDVDEMIDRLIDGVYDEIPVSRAGRNRTPKRIGDLPPDPLRRLGLGGFHWAGNLNVFVSDTPVERHLGRAIRIHPGRLNVAVFHVGSSRVPDTYAFSIERSALEWDVSLHRNFSFTARTFEASRIKEKCWQSVSADVPVYLIMQPPLGTRRGDVLVNVKQRSTGKETVVEFCMDADAAGSGCWAGLSAP